MKTLLILFYLLSVVSVFADECASPYSQCGGSNWSGSLCCISGYNCKEVNTWYSQCIPASNSSKKSKSKNPNKSSSGKNKNSNKDSKKDNNKSNTKTNETPYINTDAEMSPDLFGYATLNGGTTGGEGGIVSNVSTQAELEAALKGIHSKIIKVNGIIKLTAEVNVSSNTSLVGADNNSGFTGAGIKIKKSNNIIIQNLKFSYCLGSNKDCINATKSTNIWIDHCEFHNDKDHGKDYYDGLVDFTHACDYITVSWCYIHDHYKASLVGHSDNNGGEDTGKLHITYHHNYFKNVGSRLPSLRFGTGHIFNNVYENIEVSSINIRMGAKALVEGNVFRNAKAPISTNRDSKIDGAVVEKNNDFGGNEFKITNTNGLSSVPYSYTTDDVKSIYDKVTKSAGPK